MGIVLEVNDDSCAFTVEKGKHFNLNCSSFIYGVGLVIMHSRRQGGK